MKWVPEAKPVADGDGPARPEGFYLLQELPGDDFIRPKGFKKGGYEDLQKTLSKVQNTLTAEDVRLWEEFAAMAPASDDVEEYMIRFPDAM